MLPDVLWKYILVAVIGVAALTHAFYPRYEFRSFDHTAAGVSVVVFDRWTGRFQRATWDEKGGLNVMGVFTPF